ncbi:hypothetical protein [Guyparkeria sp.]|uniref:FimV/HubP-related protein n=1 Tax=Guyparkeria sp. TaxID=2035736 RepID=UPI0035664C94
MRKLSLVIAGILGAGGPLISQAATLGDARVQSYLTEPLEVSVPLARSSNEPLDEVSVQLAPPAFYEQAGVPLESLPANLIFTVETKGGQDYVFIRSRGPVRDPILSILLEVRSPEGRMIREYNLLLDPPSSGTTTQSTPAAAGTPVADQAPSAPRADRSSWERVTPATDLELDDSYEVQRGDTLSQIAGRYAAEGEDIRPIMQAIIDANPNAFVNGNGNALMADAELRVPSAQPTDDGEEAGAEAQGPALELLGPEERAAAEAGDSAEQATGDETSRANVLPAIEGPTRAELQRQAVLDQEEIESARAENESLTEDLRSLTEQIDTIKLSIDERESKISELEAAVDQAHQEKIALEQQNAQLEELKGNFWIEWGKYLVGGLGLLVLALLIALGLRRGRRNDDEPALPAQQTDVDSSPDIGPSSTRGEAAGAVAMGAGAGAATIAAGSDTDDEEEAKAGSNAAGQDPLDPQMALDEARMLESFNLNQQAIDLLQDSLTEHPGHEGLQEALARLQSGEGIQQPEQDSSFAAASDTDQGAETLAPGMSFDDAQSAEEGDQLQAFSQAEGSEDSRESEFEEPEQETRAESSPAGMIDWDDDLDNMLATPDSEAEPGRSDDSDELMDFDDSYALETPANEEPAEAVTGTDGEEIEFDLPDHSQETASTSDSDEEGAFVTPTGAEREADDTLNLQDAPEEEIEDRGTIATEDSDSSSDDNGQDAVDTRVSLAEAFLDVGDRESFEMIESELREEGATDALHRLDNLKKRYG